MHLRKRVPSGESIKPLSAFTPRWSKEPPSPFFVVGSADGAASESTGVVAFTRNEKRGVTPSAYATPFSGTVAAARVGGDTELDSGEEDVWEGVEENQVREINEDKDMEDEGYDDDEDGEDEEGSDTSMDEGDVDEDYDDVLSQDELQLEPYFPQ